MVIPIVVTAAMHATPLVAQARVRVTTISNARDSLQVARERAGRDSAKYREDSLWAFHDSVARARRQASIVPVTPALLATAFHDQPARQLLARARAARLTQDASLTSYDATTYERFSLKVSLSRFIRERLLFRSERTSHVQWSRAGGAIIDITGARSGSPMFGDDADIDLNSRVPIPYFPGRDALWIGSGLARANVSDRAVLNPLANGAEAYYTYSTGDSLVFQLPNSRSIVVRELRVHPRKPRWDLVVGSLWFDVSGGELVRAVYRLAEPMDVLMASAAAGDDPRAGMSAIQRAFVPSIKAQISVITVDYGLFEGRFWMPRAQTAEGEVTVGAVRVPMQVQQHFDYASVNGTADLPPAQINPLDTATSLAAYIARDSSRYHECDDTSAQRLRTHLWYDKTLPVAIRTPCDTVGLAHSPTLPPSIYSSTDTLFRDDERLSLINRALGLPAQAAWQPQPPTLSYGLGYTRYNRVEGVSTGVALQQVYGAGYTGHALARFGFADRMLNGEIGMTRSDGHEALTFNVYRRLTSASDWGNPFSAGASLTALLFGRDDGIYYRSWGAELTHEQSGGIFDSWRLFAEQQFDASTQTQFSLPNAFGDHQFRENGDIDATNGSVVGLALSRHGALGEDPKHFRAVSDLRLEGATGSFDYVRGMMDVTVDEPLTRGLRGALTVSGGSSGGTLPTQRLWYLGGPYTIRGQPIATQAGNAYWFTRAELGSSAVGFKPFIFADLGWAGSRNQWTSGVQPISGGGVGASVLDGLLHFDLAKGIHPTRGVQIDAYLDTRF